LGFCWWEQDLLPEDEAPCCFWQHGQCRRAAQVRLFCLHTTLYLLLLELARTAYLNICVCTVSTYTVHTVSNTISLRFTRRVHNVLAIPSCSTFSFFRATACWNDNTVYHGQRQKAVQACFCWWQTILKFEWCICSHVWALLIWQFINADHPHVNINSLLCNCARTIFLSTFYIATFVLLPHALFIKTWSLKLYAFILQKIAPSSRARLYQF